MERNSRPPSLDRRSRIALVLWLVLAFVVWNVIFDRVLVLAGRRFVHDASRAARQGGDYLLIEDRMSGAILDALRWAGVAAAAILVVAFIAVPLARSRAGWSAGQQR